MKLIIVLISLGLERYLNIGTYLHRFTWLDAYVHFLQSYIDVNSLKPRILGLLVLVLPVLIIVSIIYLLIPFLWFSVLLNLIVLVYCLGPANFFQTPSSHTMPSTIFWEANQQIIAVLFWFIVLGPWGFIGVLLYRCVTCLYKIAEHKDSSITDLKSELFYLQSLLDWIPVRLTTLIYILVGQDKLNLSLWSKQVLGGLTNNYDFLTTWGLRAIGVSENESQATIDENHAALRLVNKVLFVILLVLALFTLGMWVG